MGYDFFFRDRRTSGELDEDDDAFLCTTLSGLLDRRGGLECVGDVIAPILSDRRDTLEDGLVNALVGFEGRDGLNGLIS